MNTTQVWNQYSQDLKRFLWSKVGDEQVASDLLQEVFVKVHTKSDQLSEPTKIKSWLFTIAHRATLDYFKSEKYTQSIEHFTDQSQEEQEKHTELDCLLGIINQLPHKYKRPLYLAHVKGYKQTAIAEKLDLPLPTVKSQIQRGRKMIAQGYMECCDYKLNSEGKLVGERKEKEQCSMCSS